MMAGTPSALGAPLTLALPQARAASDPTAEVQAPRAGAVPAPLATVEPASSDTNRSDQLDELLREQPHDITVGGLLKSAGDGLKSLFIPRNVDETMTKDYLPTRAWWLGREVMSNLSYGFAASQATSLALELLVKAQPGAAVATVGLGLGMYWFPKVVDQFRNVTSMATSTVAPVADRRPKAWFLAGDILDSSANAVMSCAALVPGLYAPLSLGVGAAFTIAGVLKRRSQSNMFYRQAINPTETLPEINTKENNQSIVLNLVSMAAGAGLQWAIGGTALAAALPVVGCAAAALGVAATVKFLSHLDMENINETVLRKTIDRLEQGEDVPEPDRRVGKLLGQLFEKDRIELGQDVDRLKQSGAARYQELLETYKDEKYLLESYKGRPYIVVKDGASREDSLKAMVQAIYLERLGETPEYSEMLTTRGSDAADYWLVQQSLSKSREVVPDLADRLEAKGWATDLVNFRDTEVSFSPEELEKPLDAGKVALP